MNRSLTIRDLMWHTSGVRFAENFLSGLTPYSTWGRLKLRRWLSKGRVETGLEDDKAVDIAHAAVLFHGEAVLNGNAPQTVYAPFLIHRSGITLKKDARILMFSSDAGEI